MSLSAANRLGLDYRRPPQRKLAGPILDIHTHVKSAAFAARFFEAADNYGISEVISMTPLENVAALRDAYPGRIEFIAIPNWGRQDRSVAFRDSWMADLERFRALGARLCKFWMAPLMRQRHGLTLDHEFLRPVVERAHQLGYLFMAHVGDPSVWWRSRYADTAVYGTKEEQYPQLEWLCRTVAPTPVIAAHMGGFVENLAFLQGLLGRHANLLLDSSATKWIVRETAWQPAAVREFVIRNADRILFGSDVVAEKAYDDFDHYASRYWAHQMLWESAYRGESPIDDPDAAQPPQLSGLDLPAEVLKKLYRENAARLGYGE